MTKLYTITGEDKTIKVIILEKATKVLLKAKQLKKGYVVIQDYNFGNTAHIEKNKLIFSEELL